MADFEENEEQADGSSENRAINKKKIMFVIIPILILVGIIVGIYVVMKKETTSGSGIAVVQIQKNSEEKVDLVLYDLPEVHVQIRDANLNFSNAKIKINIEISKTADVERIEALMPKILDAIISHTSELNLKEISGAKGLYWLREEILYRINTIVDPVVVHNVNFKTFEIQK